jgi:hypothetical protein
VKRSRPLSEEADLRRRIRSAARELSRAIEKGPRTEATRLYDQISGPWQSESIQKMVAHLPASEEDRLLSIALLYHEESLSRVMSERAKRPRPEVLGKNAKRDQWIREQYRQRKSRDRSYSVARFCRDLHLGRIKIPTDLTAQRQPSDLSDERVRKIIKDR